MLQSRQVIAFARALLLSALLGCGSPEEATPTAEPAATPTSLAAPEAAAENADAPALPATPPAAADGPAPVLEIGYTEVPAQPSTAQMRLNRQALAAHSSGDYATSRTLFAQLAEQSGGYPTYRVNLACALSRAGALEEAAAVLEPLLAMDLPTYRRMIETDEDLAPLRTGPVATRLAAHVARVELGYRQAAREGVPAMLRLSESLLRGGVWWHAPRRFVPLGPAVRDASSVLADPEVGHVATIFSSDLSDNFSMALQVDPLYGEGPPLVRAERLGAGAGAVYPTATGARGRFMFEPLSVISNAVWYEYGAGDPVRSATQDPPDRWHVSGDHLTPPGYDEECLGARSRCVGEYTLRNNSLHIGEREIPLSPGQAMGFRKSLAADAARHLVIVVGSDELRHVIDRVNLETGVVTLLHRGDGPATLRSTADGALYLQFDGRLHRLPDMSAPVEGAETSFAGVILSRY
ncbi:MAG: hypothetical protein IPG17_30830 [Sandaracinaceae bacterium]|nr:hypothetical protein [Sandaracinaceae bacterium]